MLKVAYNEFFAHPLPEGHRFPMEKYTLIPMQLMHEGTMEESDFFSPEEVSERHILRVHKEEYLSKLKTLNLSKKEVRAMGFPISERLVSRELMITKGTMDAVGYAMNYGVSGNIAGGTHHAYSDRGEGFCLLNDIAVSAAYALEELDLKKIMVVDLDVHQGNGTAKIFENDSRVFTLSIHGEKNYPLHKEKSDLDIPMPDGTEDEEYLRKLSEILPGLIDDLKPDLIFYQSGVDILKTDKLGRLSLSIEGCKQRDMIVFESAQKRGIPVVFNMGGGYSEKISTIVEAHSNTFRVAKEIYF